MSNYTIARLLTIVAVKKVYLAQLDMKNTFLYGGMDVTV